MSIVIDAMKNYRLLSQVLGGVWLMDPEDVKSYLPSITKLLTADNPSSLEVSTEESKETLPFSYSHVHSETYDSYDDAPHGSIAVIPVKGPLMKQDYCGDPGTATLAKRVQEADEHPSIVAIVFQFDSPGGAADAGEILHNAILQTTKPTIGHVELAASLGYLIACACDHIMIDGKVSRIGSIGTFATLYDFADYYAELGIKVHEIYASASTEKNKPYREALKNNYLPIQQDVLDKYNLPFIESVQDTRGEFLNADDDKILKGKVYFGQDNIAAGLADTMGSFDEALVLAHEMGTPQQVFKSNSNMFKQLNKTLNTLMSKIKGGDAEATAEEIAAVNEQLEAEGCTSIQLVSTQAFEQLGASAESAESRLTTIQEAVDAISEEEVENVESFDLPEAIQSLQEQVETLTKERDTAQAKVAKLEGKADPPKQTAKEKEEVDKGEPEAYEFETSADRKAAELANQTDQFSL